MALRRLPWRKDAYKIGKQTFNIKKNESVCVEIYSALPSILGLSTTASATGTSSSPNSSRPSTSSTNVSSNVPTVTNRNNHIHTMCKTFSSSIRTFVSSQSCIELGHDNAPVFKPRRALILTKMTRYEYEKKMCQSQGMTEEEDLKIYLEAKQSDYLGLLERHEGHYTALKCIEKHLVSSGIETEIVNRWQYDRERIEWADVVFSAGGDGTFLLAASKMKNKNKPLIGLNTDPERSEGYLCLPKNKYSALNFDKALKRLRSADFSWKWRQRIRITMSGQHDNEEPIELHDQQLKFPEHRFSEHIGEHEEMRHNFSTSQSNTKRRILPVLALNEVFIGESLSSRVSYYEIKVDNCPSYKQKSSGVTVCTGTGSSSWFFHINHLGHSGVKEILKIGSKFTGYKFPVQDDNILDKITQAFNNTLRFDASEPYMAYTIRDPVINAVYKVDKPRDFAKRIKIRSRMWDSALVIDGGLSFRFNDGAVATLEIFEEDALRIVDFN